MICEHFIHGHFNGVGYKLIKTDGVDKLISTKTLNILKGYDSDKKVFWPYPENVFSFTFTHNGSDEYGRRTVWNHTMLVSVEEYLKGMPDDLFREHFITEMPTSLRLSPLKIGVHK